MRRWSLADAPCARLNISVNSTAITIGDHNDHDLSLMMSWILWWAYLTGSSGWGMK